MKKKTLKPWVESIIVVILFMTILVISCESDSIAVFFIKNIIAFVVMFGCYYILDKYGKIFR